MIYITGTRGSGKSFDLGVLVEGISKLASPSPIQNVVKPITAIIIDTQSQFWTLGYAPREAIVANKVQLDELKALEMWLPIAFRQHTSTRHLRRQSSLGQRKTLAASTEGCQGRGSGCGFLGQEGLQPARPYYYKYPGSSWRSKTTKSRTFSIISRDDSKMGLNVSGLIQKTRYPTKLDDYRRTDLFSSRRACG